MFDAFIFRSLLNVLLLRRTAQYCMILPPHCHRWRCLQVRHFFSVLICSNLKVRCADGYIRRNSCCRCRMIFQVQKAFFPNPLYTFLRFYVQTLCTLYTFLRFYVQIGCTLIPFLELFSSAFLYISALFLLLGFDSFYF